MLLLLFVVVVVRWVFNALVIFTNLHDKHNGRRHHNNTTETSATPSVASGTVCVRKLPHSTTQTNFIDSNSCNSSSSKNPITIVTHTRYTHSLACVAFYYVYRLTIIWLVCLPNPICCWYLDLRCFCSCCLNPGVIFIRKAVNMR